MIVAEARAIVQDVLRPLSADAFFDAIGAEVLASKAGPDQARADLFGSDPQATLLDAFATHAARLDCHGVAPSQPPPQAVAVPDRAGFHDLVRRFHERDYTVRVPDVVPLSPALQRFARALELMLHQPVDASVFWSKAGAKATVHYDKRDNIIIQLSGRKRWFISSDPPGLQNNWEHVGEPLPDVSRHQTYDVEPGDLLYIPRGTPHTVESTTESLHLAILFTPVTLRDTIVAALDHLSDLDRSFRQTAVRHATHDDQRALPSKAVEGLERLLVQCRSPGFVARAMEDRASRIIGQLPRLTEASTPQPLTPESRIAHAELGVGHLMTRDNILDFSQPGGHISVHPGAEPALRFIMNTASFRIRDVPDLSDDVRIALVGRLIESGLLRLDG